MIVQCMWHVHMHSIMQCTCTCMFTSGSLLPIESTDRMVYSRTTRDRVHLVCTCMYTQHASLFTLES